MEDIGKYLKEQRERQEMTLGDVSRSTRLKTEFLQKIENNEFTSLGEPGHIKMMIITVCRAVNGNEEIVKNRLNKLFDQPTPPPLKIDTAKNVKPVIFSVNIIYFFFLGVLVVVLSISIYSIYKKGSFPSFTEIKNQFSAVEKKVTRQTAEEELQPDSLWIFQRSILNNLKDNDSGQPEVIADTVSPKPKQTSMYFKNDHKDYIGELIFKDIESPLNIKID